MMRLPHWSLTEMRAAFDFTVEQYLLFGGHPDAAPLARDSERWRRAVTRTLLVGEGGIPLEEFLRTPVEGWLGP